MVELVRHRQTKEAATDRFYLRPPRHISTLPWSCENAVAWRSDRIDHLFDCEFRCEDCYARWISVDLGKTILVAPELAGFSHSQGHTGRSATFQACPPHP